jgi:hypothetical protein
VSGENDGDGGRRDFGDEDDYGDSDSNGKSVMVVTSVYLRAHHDKRLHLS